MKNLLVLLFIICVFTPQASYAQKRPIKKIRIVQIEAYDQGNYADGAHDFPIDIVQNICNEGDEENELEEPFFDTVVGLFVVNKTEVPVLFKKSRVIIRNLAGKRIRSRKLNLINIGFIDPDETKKLLLFALKTDDGQKVIHRKKGAVELGLGGSNVAFKVFGRDAHGKPIRRSGRIALSFRDVDRCS